MSGLLHSHSAFRIFAISFTLSGLALVLVLYYLGPQAALLTFILIIIEITFSFDNAIINAKVLRTMSYFWQQMFMTIGILIAVFGMRIIFPIVVVMVTAGLSWNEVLGLAFQQPDRYAAELDRAHPTIAAFGGTFLLMLALQFFFDTTRRVSWLGFIERPMQNISRPWLYAVISLTVVTILSLVPFNAHPRETFIAGVVGVITYLFIHGLTGLFPQQHKESAGKTLVPKVGLAGFMAFLYLEVLDASFSFDSVIGAFAITKEIILIGVGLGVGALWVRSLTLFMVRRQTLTTYRYLEHGAHYAIAMLAVVLLLGLFFKVSEIFAGLASIIIIGTAVVSSLRAKKKTQSSPEGRA